MMDSFTKRLHNSYLDNVHVARLFPVFLAILFIGLVFFSGIYLEYLITLNTAELVARGYDGELTTTEAARLPYIALVFCRVGLAFLHRPVGHLFKLVNTTLYTWAFIITMAVILSNPFLLMIDDLRLSGNSLEFDPSAGNGVEAWLTGIGLTFRILVIGMAAILASVGIHLIISAIKGIARCAKAKRNSGDIAKGISNMSEGAARTEEIRATAIDFNGDMAADFSRGMVGGLLSAASTQDSFLTGQSKAFQTSQQWIDSLRLLHEDDTTPRDPRIAALVKDRLREMTIPLEELPNSVSELSDEAQTTLLDHSKWLRASAHFDTILASVKLNKRDLNYV